MAALSAALLALAVPLLLVVGSCDAADGYGVAGPYRVIAEQVEQCKPDEVDIPFSVYAKLVRDRHDFHTWYLSGNTTLHFTTDDRISGRILIDSWSSRGGWKPNAFKLETQKLCTFAETWIPDAWRRIKQSAFGNPDRRCPLPPGFYAIHNVTAKLNDETRAVPAFFYGRYRAHLFALQTTKRVACAMWTVRVVPKYVHVR